MNKRKNENQNIETEKYISECFELAKGYADDYYKIYFNST